MMPKNNHKNLQHQIENLIPIIELYLLLIEEVNKTQHKLKSLYPELKQLKQQAEFLKAEETQLSHGSPTYNSQLKIQETELKLAFLVNDLQAILIHLATFNYKINNVVALKERLEALQEPKTDQITPANIYKLLAKKDK